MKGSRKFKKKKTKENKSSTFFSRSIDSRDKPAGFEKVLDKPRPSSPKFVLRRWYLYAVLASLFFSFLSTFIVDQIFIQKAASLETLYESPFKDFIPSDYPLLSKDLSSGSDLSADAAVIMDDDSKVVIFSKNPMKRLSMASTTKIMTALVALDYYKLDDVLVIDEERIEGSKVGFVNGEKVTVENLLYGLLLPSGNDAAFALAQNFPGGEKNFIEKMNGKAETLHLFNTKFADATGLLDDENYTAPIDLARLSSFAMNNPIIARIVATERKTISDVEGRKTYNLENLNKLLEIEGVEGVKTGFTDKARGVLVTSKRENGHRFIVVVIKSEDRFADTKKLFDLLSSVSFLSIRP